MDLLKLPRGKLQTLYAYGTAAGPVVMIVLAIAGAAWKSHLEFVALSESCHRLQDRVDNLPTIMTTREEFRGLDSEFKKSRAIREKLSSDQEREHGMLNDRLAAILDSNARSSEKLSSIATKVDLLMKAHSLGPVSKRFDAKEETALRN